MLHVYMQHKQAWVLHGLPFEMTTLLLLGDFWICLFAYMFCIVVMWGLLDLCVRSIYVIKGKKHLKHKMLTPSGKTHLELQLLGLTYVACVHAT